MPWMVFRKGLLFVWRLSAMSPVLLAAMIAGAHSAPAETAAPVASSPAPTEQDSGAALEKAKAAALEQMRAGHFAEAVPLAEQALRLTEKQYGPEAVETAVAAHNLGFLLRRVDRVADARQHLERALAIYEREQPAVHEDTRNLVGELGQIYLREGRGDEIIAIYDRLIARAEREGEAGHIGVAHMHNNAAFVLRMLGRPDQSEIRWQQAIAIYDLVSSPEDEPYRLAVEALLDRYATTGRLEKARTLIDDTLETLRSRGQEEGKAALRMLNHAARLEQDAGRFSEAKEKAEAALAIVERRGPEADKELVEPLNNLARAERALANYAAAEASYKRAIDILDAQADVANSGILNDNLAVLYGHMGRLDDAEPRHRRAIQLLEQALGREHREVGQAAANFGVFLNEAGRLDEAEPLLRRGLAIAEAQLPQDPVSIAIITDNLAGLMRQTGRNDEAMQNLRRALALFEKSLPPDHPTLATVHNNLGRLLIDIGRPAEAEAALRRALEIDEGLYGAEHVNTAVPAANLGEAYAALDQREKARGLLKRALTILERQFGESHAKLVDTLVALGALELANSHPSEALGYFERAVAITLAFRSRSGVRNRAAIAQSNTERRAFSGLLDALWKTGGTDDKAKAAHALEIGEWSTMTSTAVALAALGARAGASDEGLRTLVRERQDLSSDWQAIDGRLTELLSQTSGRNADLEQTLRERLAAIETRIAALDQDLQAKFPRYGDFARPAPLSIAELQQLLGPNEAAIQYVVTREATHLWLISKTETQWRRLPLGERDALSLVRALRCGLDQEEWADKAGRERCMRLLEMPPDASPRAADPLPFRPDRAHALYSMLLGPIAGNIAGKDLLIVASGALTSLPFSVLVTEKPGSSNGAGPVPIAWLARKHAVTMLPSLGSLKTLRTFAVASHAAAPFLGVGNPLLSGDDGTDRRAWSHQACGPAATTPRWSAEVTSLTSVAQLLRRGLADVETLRRQVPIPETADELCSVAQFIGAPDGAVLLGGDATEGRIKSLSSNGALADARILHFATHGLLAGETELFLAAHAEPALMLTPPDIASQTDDGLLTASEIAELKLDADWVVLSACNTASGDHVGAEALSGLARAFFYAGARSLMVSHWAVNSDTTVKLVTRAFAAMTQNPQLTQAAALQHAMLTLVDAPGLQSHPAYWAPFIVVGGNAAAPVQLSPTLVSAAAEPASSAVVAASTAKLTGGNIAAVASNSPATIDASAAEPAQSAATTGPSTSSDVAGEATIAEPATGPVPDEIPPLPPRVYAGLRAAITEDIPPLPPRVYAGLRAEITEDIPPLPTRAPAVLPTRAAKPAHGLRRTRKKQKALSTSEWEQKAFQP